MTCALPGLIAVTAMGALTWPAGTNTVSGVAATARLVLITATGVSLC